MNLDSSKIGTVEINKNWDEGFYNIEVISLKR